MDSPDRKIEIPLCPKCKEKWYMIVTLNKDNEAVYKCPRCNYEINPDK